MPRAFASFAVALVLTLASPPRAAAQRVTGCHTFSSGGREYAICVVLEESLFAGEQGVPTAWLAYGLARAKWVREHGAPDARPATAFAEAFAEELDARQVLADVWAKLKTEQPARRNRYLDGVLRAHQAGFLPEYVWVYHRASHWQRPAEPLRLAEFARWRDAELRGHSAETMASITVTEQSGRPGAPGPAAGRGATPSGRYGYSPDDPIKVGGAPQDQGPRNEHEYLGRLRGPRGQAVQYRRIDSCCHFNTPNAPAGMRALLDRYAVTYEGLREPVVLYLNMYDHEAPRAPEGFTLAPRPTLKP